jgi:LysR family transcriptional regulator (chromosome initiation inhibitor)
MLDSRCLEALSAVIRLGSFERAAEDLGLTQSAVSQRIKRLESQFGEPLLVRSKPVVATAAGDRVFQYVLNARLMERDLRADTAEGRVQPFERLRIALNADSLATWFAEVPALLFHRHGLLSDLAVDDETRTLDILKAGHVLLSIGTRADAVQGLRMTRLGSLDYFPVASPDFVARFFPKGLTAEALRGAPAVIFGRHDELHHLYLERHFRIGPGDFPRHVVPSSEGFVTAARQGIAYALCAEPQVREALAKGELIRLDVRGVSRRLVLHARENAPRSLDAVIADIRAVARRTLAPPSRRGHEKPTISS